jgi:hypothetical protein
MNPIVGILDPKCYGDNDEWRGTAVRLLMVETFKRSPGGRRMADALPSEKQNSIRNHHFNSRARQQFLKIARLGMNE